MKICVFGGSFNPVHKGHEVLVRSILANTNVNCVWVMVSNSIQKTYTVNFWDRVTMCNLAFKDIDNTLVSSFESGFFVPTPTYNVLTLLAKVYPQHEFSFLIGSDQLANITTWENYDKLLNQFKFYCIGRGYQEDDEYLSKQYPNVSFIQPIEYIKNISSTNIREQLKQKRIPSELHSEVYEYIKQNNLYAY